ncbi:hypothetical protein M3661_09140 [Paenibacillus sp. MER 180]|uniref:hypothetical protein n=1 Tax=Paenibacillus sp. MER 180 TaxID=2939570 RepID=UPI002041ABAA|nr:hypothetical protein [Paenibacillus sp. MER 180]MCM3290291.1 hypothetical protein [Paenibacillus sp. MER 180]
MTRMLLSNRYHFSSLQMRDGSLLFEPQEHCLIECPKPVIYHDAAGPFGVCQDDAHYVHLVYVNRDDQLIHVSINPCSLQSHKREIAGVFKHVRHIQLTNCHNQLHAVIQYRSRIEHVSLSGIHWSTADVLYDGEEIHSLRLFSHQDHIWLCTALITTAPPHQQLRLLLQSFHTASSRWLPSTSLPVVPLESREDLLAYELYSVQRRLGMFRFQRIGNKLLFAAYEWNKQKEWTMTAHNQTIIPPTLTAQVICAYDQGRYRLSWVTEDLLFRIHYSIHQEEWSDLYTTAIQCPVIWTCIYDKQSGRDGPTVWIVSDQETTPDFTGSAAPAVMQGYRATRDLTHSIDSADALIASIAYMRECCRTRKKELVQLKQIQKDRQATADRLTERIAALQEEVQVRLAIQELSEKNTLLMKKEDKIDSRSGMKEQLSRIVLKISNPR